MSFSPSAKHLFYGSTIAFIIFAVTASLTNAQYPPPVGSASLSAAAPTVAVGGSTTLSTQILDQFGAPIVGVDVVFTIASEPGTDAALGSKTVTKVTDARGIATANLMVGSTPGVIVITSTAGVTTTSTLVQVASGSVAAPAPGAPVQPLPPASIILPPNTGEAGWVTSADEAGAPVLPFIVAGSLTVLLLLTAAARRRQGSRI
jgi:hypothetical protein